LEFSFKFMIAIHCSTKIDHLVAIVCIFISFCNFNITTSVVFNDGQTKQMLQLEGTIPVIYKGEVNKLQ